MIWKVILITVYWLIGIGTYTAHEPFRSVKYTATERMIVPFIWPSIWAYAALTAIEQPSEK